MTTQHFSISHTDEAGKTTTFPTALVEGTFHASSNTADAETIAQIEDACRFLAEDEDALGLALDSIWTVNKVDAATPLQALLAELAEAKRQSTEADLACRDRNDSDTEDFQKAATKAHETYNHLRAKERQVHNSFAALVQVGDPVTRSGYSDCHAGYVFQINETRTKLVMRDGDARLLNGANSGEPDALVFSPGGFCGHTSGTQRWEITPSDNARVTVFTLRKNGRWIETGLAHNQGRPLCAGHHHHHDFNF